MLLDATKPQDNANGGAGGDQAHDSGRASQGTEVRKLNDYYCSITYYYSAIHFTIYLLLVLFTGSYYYFTISLSFCVGRYNFAAEATYL